MVQNTVLVGTAGRVVLAPGRSDHYRLANDETKHTAANCHPMRLEDHGGRVGITAPVLQPHAAVPPPPWVPEFQQVRRAPLRRADFEQFGYTDNCSSNTSSRSFKTVPFPRGGNFGDDH